MIEEFTVVNETVQLTIQPLNSRFSRLPLGYSTIYELNWFKKGRSLDVAALVFALLSSLTMV